MSTARIIVEAETGSLQTAVPALRRGDGQVIPGWKGCIHQDIYAAQGAVEGNMLRMEEPTPEHGFLWGGQFITKEQLGHVLHQASAVDAQELRRLQQEDPVAVHEGETKKFMRGLQAKAAEEVTFGFAITTSDEEAITTAARAAGWLELTDEQWEQINADVLRLERNMLGVLEKCGIRTRDEGHAGDGDLVGTAWAAQQGKVHLKRWHEDHEGGGADAFATTGFIYQAYEGAVDDVWRGISNLGETLLDAYVHFFDYDPANLVEAESAKAFMKFVKRMPSPDEGEEVDNGRTLRRMCSGSKLVRYVSIWNIQDGGKCGRANAVLQIMFAPGGPDWKTAPGHLVRQEWMSYTTLAHSLRYWRNLHGAALYVNGRPGGAVGYHNAELLAAYDVPTLRESRAKRSIQRALQQSNPVRIVSQEFKDGRGFLAVDATESSIKVLLASRHNVIKELTYAPQIDTEEKQEIVGTRLLKGALLELAKREPAQTLMIGVETFLAPMLGAPLVTVERDSLGALNSLIYDCPLLTVIGASGMVRYATIKHSGSRDVLEGEVAKFKQAQRGCRWLHIDMADSMRRRGFNVTNAHAQFTGRSSVYTFRPERNTRFVDLKVENKRADGTYYVSCGKRFGVEADHKGEYRFPYNDLLWICDRMGFRDPQMPRPGPQQEGETVRFRQRLKGDRWNTRDLQNLLEPRGWERRTSGIPGFEKVINGDLYTAGSSTVRGDVLVCYFRRTQNDRWQHVMNKSVPFRSFRDKVVGNERVLKALFESVLSLEPGGGSVRLDTRPKAPKSIWTHQRKTAEGAPQPYHRVRQLPNGKTLDMWIAYHKDNAPRRLLHLVKEYGPETGKVAAKAAGDLAFALKDSGITTVVPMPSTKPLAQRFARLLANRLGVPLVPALNKEGSVHKVPVARRKVAAQALFQVTGSVEGASVLLVDDYIVTAASQMAAATKLYAAGAWAVHGAALAI